MKKKRLQRGVVLLLGLAVLVTALAAGPGAGATPAGAAAATMVTSPIPLLAADDPPVTPAGLATAGTTSLTPLPAVEGLPAKPEDTAAAKTASPNAVSLNVLTPIPSLLVDDRPVRPAVPLRREGRAGDTILVPLRELSAYLVAGCQWNAAEKTAWIQKYGRTILFRLATGEVRKNSVLVAAPVPARLIDNTVYVPLRFVAENLGAMVHWDARASQIRIVTGERHEPPARVDSTAFNAVVAYTSGGKLWLLDGREPGALPQQLTASGHAELIGWSADGSWLAYTYRAETETGAEKTNLWAVRSDGSGARQVDAEPLHSYDDPQWSPSPAANRLAYTVQEDRAGDYIPASIVKCAQITRNGEIEVKTLLKENVVLIPSLAWAPDGESLTVSFPRCGEQPPRLEQVDLNGQREVLYTFKDEVPIDPQGLYPWALIGLQWSPDGQYLAYRLRLNSGSLTADSVASGVLRVTAKEAANTATVNSAANLTANLMADPATDPMAAPAVDLAVKLSSGLRYPEWLAFSPDSKKLASIAGAGRDVVFNKWLEIAALTAAGGKATDCGRQGFIDTEPCWLPGEPAALLFCRGPESPPAISSADVLPGVLVPGQRIYKLAGEEGRTAAALTAGPVNTADYYPSPSPSGLELIFLRLERFDRGSLYLQPTDAPEKAIEILRGLQGTPGFYGNYYPRWVSIHWF